MFPPALSRAYATKTVSGPPIPDPVKLLRRISALEQSIAVLRTESREVGRLRAEVARGVTESLSKNVLGIRELAIRSGQDNGDNSEWNDTAVKVAEQNKCWNPTSGENLSGRCDEGAAQPHSSDVLSEFVRGGKLSSGKRLEFTERKDDTSSSPVITERMFLTIPPAVRGRATIEHVRHVAILVHEEHWRRFDAGAGGRGLVVTRQQLLQMRAPGLRSVLSNAAVWRDIASSLKALGLVRLDREGNLTWTDPSAKERS
eukprot:CAMPEP_0113548160 /NCGR_PEP_ID=MMETSP0015_2-20120614/12744_1 /TAXON_ID=2838 /ORGANISM="Odontella" /LENGTH=257 /DNA_ID=CAMNT_0000448769 /DNA_START=680 /DNA_END=1454 /DNA_ORIENTATION=+ /assembly_acc=CAM_ASM_000160